MENRTERITFRLTSSELNKIENKARKANMRVSQYVRNSTLDKEIIVIKELEQFSKEIRGIGRNLNQLAILCHQGKVTCPNIDGVERMVEEIWQLLSLLTAKTKRKKN